jgi:hypothetical protein
MAEGIMKKFYGTGTYVQSVGVLNDLEIDGFAIATCEEIGVELSRHRSRSFDEMEQWGDDLSSFDLIVGAIPCQSTTRTGINAVFSFDGGILANSGSNGVGRNTRYETVVLSTNA